MITVRYTKKIPIYTRKRDVAHKDIVANVAVQNGNRFPAESVTSVTIEDGNVIYRVKSVPQAQRELYIYTAVARRAG